MKFNTTKNYREFNLYNFNRPVDTTSSKFKALLANVSDLGYIICPIIVDGNKFVIDGQHRLEVCKILKWEVPYVTNDKANDNDVEYANTYHKPWALGDFIHNRANTGDEACIYLQELMSDYNEFPIACVADVFCGHPTKKANSLIKSGGYTINDKLGHEVLSVCRELESVTNKFNNVKLVRALTFIIKHNDHFDVDHFKNKCNTSKLHIFNNEADIIEEIAEIYNRYTKEDKKITI